MKALLILMTVLIPTTSKAMDLTDLSLEYKKAIKTNRHWSIPGSEKKHGELNLHLRMDNKYVFSKAAIYTMFTDHQFRYGALEGEFGFKVKACEVFIHHKSEHMLDGEYDTLGGKYPNQNAIGIRIDLK